MIMTNKFIKLTRSEDHSPIILNTDRIVSCGSNYGKSLVRYQVGDTTENFGADGGVWREVVEESIDAIFDMLTSERINFGHGGPR